MFKIKSLGASFAVIILLLCADVQAVVIDFHGTSQGAPVTSIEDISFSLNTGLDLVVSSMFDAASGENYLGVNKVGFEVFLAPFGDAVTLEFASANESLSVSFISTPSAPEGSFRVTTELSSVASLATPDAILSDGGEVFNVAGISVTPFFTANLSGGGDFNLVHSFNIAFVSVSEPSGHLMIGPGYLLLLLAHKLPPGIRDQA